MPVYLVAGVPVTLPAVPAAPLPTKPPVTGR